MLPMSYEVIRDNKITVISARDQYESIYPNDPDQWKEKVFLQFLKTDKQLTHFIFGPHDMARTLIVIGDSYGEIEAGEKLSERFPNCFYKSVKFGEQPGF
jgi:hypothetical protein